MNREVKMLRNLLEIIDDYAYELEIKKLIDDNVRTYIIMAINYLETYYLKDDDDNE